ncbi:sensor histidine kinase [Mucilaginibacter sp. AK015]|uniref:sensor histidine kinase n=1 Tax=Mucilaginibacter sp. AK015 TaxID=2723072 RepID=UPI00160ECDBD|nr:sensor histidine kinase [Mucilaginibacter sp. AK015]MBB5395210.1 sensor histidine kinase YesM [Mucilaginibacter sp. AK015]
MSLFQSQFFIYPGRGLRWLQHVSFWLLLLGLRFYLTNISFNVYGGFPVSSMLLLNTCSTGVIVLFYYTLVYYLWPKYFISHQYIKGVLLILFLLVIYTISDAIAEKFLISSCAPCMARLAKTEQGYFQLMKSDLSNIVLVRLATFGTPFFLLLTLTIPISIKTALNAYRSNMRSVTLAKEKLELELNFLRAQLNPHFLFNSMNNIYGLIIGGDKERSAGLVSRLSELLRYMLYESEAETMPLSKEIKLMSDYIELEKVRLNFTRVTFNPPTILADIGIAPLLLIPLIENAFKFTPDEPGAFIDIVLTVTPDSINFKIENSVDPTRPDGLSGGIGLGNLRKRLELYYPGRYRYEISNNGINYLVNLALNL